MGLGAGTVTSSSSAGPIEPGVGLEGLDTGPEGPVSASCALGFYFFLVGCWGKGVKSKSDAGAAGQRRGERARKKE